MVPARSMILGLLGLAGASAQSGVLAEPFVPADDGVILERLPPVDPELKRKLRLIRTAFEANPGHPGLALSLALAYARLGRAEGIRATTATPRPHSRPGGTNSRPPYRCSCFGRRSSSAGTSSIPRSPTSTGC